MGLGFLGGLISGAEDDVSTSTNKVEVSDPSQFESMLRGRQESLFNEISQLTNATGLGSKDVKQAVGAQKGIADLLQEMQRTSGLPSSKDISTSQELTKALFEPQRVAMQQGFRDQSILADREAARLGRGGSDSILRNKLAQEQTRQSALLEAQQGASAQQLAFQLPGQRLGFAAQRADVLGGLANQAFTNRSSLLALGNQLSEQERLFRLNTATRTQTNVKEGSLGQALSGAAAGFGQDLSIASSIMGMGAGMPSLGGMGGGGGGGGAQSGGGAPMAMAASVPIAASSPMMNQNSGFFGPPSSMMSNQIFPGVQGGLVQSFGPQGTVVTPGTVGRSPFNMGGRQ